MAAMTSWIPAGMLLTGQGRFSDRQRPLFDVEGTFLYPGGRFFHAGRLFINHQIWFIINRGRFFYVE